MSVKLAVDARAYFAAPLKGEGKTLSRLYRELLTIRPEWRVAFLGWHPLRGDNLLAGVDHCVFGGACQRLGLWENWAFPAKAWQLKADLLHCASSGGPIRAPAPVVLTVHDLIPVMFDDGLSPSTVRQFREQLRKGLRSARAVIAVSGHTKSDLIKSFEVDPQRVHVVHWGADEPPHIDPRRNEVAVLREAGVTEPFFLAFGGSARRKNTQGLLECFADFAKRNREVGLVLIGAGRGIARQEVDQLIAKRDVADRVRILLDVPDALLDVLYRHALCLAYLSLYEGFGLPVLEAMVRGVPVLAADRTSIPEIAGDAALFVDPTDHGEVVSALERLCTDARLRADLSNRGTRRAQQFQWRQTAEQTARIFEQALASR
jgi:glycosyltransferase involved in cell wall biosynthesis